MSNDPNKRYLHMLSTTQPKLHPTAPAILEYFQNPKGTLAINLARVEYALARANGCDHRAALEFADAELDTIGLGGRDDVGAYVSADWRPPPALSVAA